MSSNLTLSAIFAMQVVAIYTRRVAWDEDTNTEMPLPDGLGVAQGADFGLTGRFAKLSGGNLTPVNAGRIGGADRRQSRAGWMLVLYGEISSRVTGITAMMLTTAILYREYLCLSVSQMVCCRTIYMKVQS